MRLFWGGCLGDFGVDSPGSRVSRRAKRRLADILCSAFWSHHQRLERPFGARTCFFYSSHPRRTLRRCPLNILRGAAARISRRHSRPLWFQADSRRSTRSRGLEEPDCINVQSYAGRPGAYDAEPVLTTTIERKEASMRAAISEPNAPSCHHHCRRRSRLHRSRTRSASCRYSGSLPAGASSSGLDCPERRLPVSTSSDTLTDRRMFARNACSSIRSPISRCSACPIPIRSSLKKRGQSADALLKNT
jgi:hypothetical protein